MKKNLNIAYLNGAEGMIRRGAASSGGSSSGDNDVLYYKLTDAFRKELEEFPDFSRVDYLGLFDNCSNFIIRGKYANGFMVGLDVDSTNNEDYYNGAMNINAFAVTVPFWNNGKQFNSFEEYNVMPAEMYERITKEEYFGMITSES